MVEDWVFLDIGEVVGISYGICQATELKICIWYVFIQVCSSVPTHEQ